MILCMTAVFAACAENTDNTTEAATDSVAKKGVFVSNSYDIYLDPAVPMPDSTPIGTGFTDNATCRKYKWISKEWEENYLHTLEENGFTVHRMMFGVFAYDKDDYLFISPPIDDKAYYESYGIEYDGEDDAEKENPTMEIACFSQPKAAGGISREEAQKIIPLKSDLLPIDVTPDGLYDMTGGQIFMLPEYSFDTEYPEGDELRSPENEWYAPRYYYIVNGTAAETGIGSIGVGDIDGDDMCETCILNYGPTSGILTCSVDVYRDGEPICVGQYFESDLQSFTEKNGRLCLLGRSDQGEEHLYDIALKKGEVSISENGHPLVTRLPQRGSLVASQMFTCDTAYRRAGGIGGICRRICNRQARRRERSGSCTARRSPSRRVRTAACRSRRVGRG